MHIQQGWLFCKDFVLVTNFNCQIPGHRSPVVGWEGWSAHGWTQSLGSQSAAPKGLPAHLPLLLREFWENFSFQKMLIVKCISILTTRPGRKILHVGAYESEHIATVHYGEKVVEEKGQTSIELDHLVLRIMDNCIVVICSMKTFWQYFGTFLDYLKEIFCHLLFRMLCYDLTGETCHHVEDVIIELLRKPAMTS